MAHFIGAIQILPTNNVWNVPLTGMPVHPQSTAYITAIDPTTKLRVKASDVTTNWGIPYNLVTNTTPTYSPTFTFTSESDPGPYPIPASPLIEEPQSQNSDKHLLCINTDNHYLYELVGAVFSGGVWSATSGAIWNLRSNTKRTIGWTSADASGMEVLPGLLLYDEVVNGRIDHVLRAALPHGPGSSWVWPASHSDGSDNTYPPDGTRFRLKASKDISSYSTINQTILTCLKTYGCIQVDGGTVAELKVYGAPDDRWSNSDLQVLNDTLTLADFEVVDASSLMISPTSYIANTSFGDTHMAQLPRRHQIQNNGTITANGNSAALTYLSSGDVPTMELLLDITGAPTGTTPSLTLNIYSQHPGSGNFILLDSFGPYTAALAAPVRHVVNGLLGTPVQVNWVVSGTTPSFGGVYLDLIFPSPSA